MKIQEMRSGILRLAKKTDDDRPEISFAEFVSDAELAAAVAPPVEPDTAPAAAPPALPPCEVDQPRWSVISFERREAGGLTYAQAAALMSQLDSDGLTGLCIVTDKAALRIGDQNSKTTFP